MGGSSTPQIQHGKAGPDEESAMHPGEEEERPTSLAAGWRHSPQSGQLYKPRPLTHSEQQPSQVRSQITERGKDKELDNGRHLKGKSFGSCKGEVQTTVVEKRFVDIKKRYKDPLLLMTDPSSTGCAASMDMHVANCADPEEIAGMAHFCEHVLFHGSRKYPAENEIYSFAGYRNGRTHNEWTNYRLRASPACCKDFEILSDDQKNIVRTIEEAVQYRHLHNQQRLFELNGSGGTGKTLTINTLIRRLIGRGKKVIVCASTGIAATLLVSRKTVHSAFKVAPNRPVPQYSAHTEQGKKVMEADVIIWDGLRGKRLEGSSAQRVGLEARDLRDEGR
ncbi:hypothetical protein QR680_012920 [Steinernema hermaphroditum]|uniref:ATP-dependent DNA helicase n=1 Tax=Steinernema hermaphroditum TaxID=289476 RepID=A0AA39I3R6_9BILA|nr:hypothetical protein QR680_012920 [Steinernema hermaphroditum]